MACLAVVALLIAFPNLAWNAEPPLLDEIGYSIIGICFVLTFGLLVIERRFATTDAKEWLLFLPAYSPDLNPIEMAFSKLKALLYKRAARTFDAITRALGDICDLFSITECRNYCKAAGYEAE